MPSIAFNATVDKLGYYAEMPAASDSWVLVLLKSLNLPTDDVLADFTTLAALLASPADECDFTNYGRRSTAVTGSGGVLRTVDNTVNRVRLDVPDFEWLVAGSSTGTGVNNTVARAVWCYSPTSGAADTALLPLIASDISATTDGNDLRYRQPNGLYLASYTQAT